MRFTNSVTIQRPAPDVFAFLARFENIPRWNPAISWTRAVTPGPVGVGSRYVQQRTAPRPKEESFEVTTYEPDRVLAVTGTFGPLPTEATYVVEAMGDATRLTNVMQVERGGIVGALAPLASGRLKAAVARNLDTLKHILEGGGS